jgi:hypothetical protein
MRLENVRMGRQQLQQGIAAAVFFVMCCAVISMALISEAGQGHLRSAGYPRGECENRIRHKQSIA